MNKLYYHILEHHGYSEIGHQGCFNTLDEAYSEIDHLQGCFPHLEYTVWEDINESEPPIVTI